MAAATLGAWTLARLCDELQVEFEVAIFNRSFAAREVFVPTLGVTYAVGEVDEEHPGLLASMRKSKTGAGSKQAATSKAAASRKPATASRPAASKKTTARRQTAGSASGNKAAALAACSWARSQTWRQTFSSASLPKFRSSMC